jgi:hypothetical protein
MQNEPYYIGALRITNPKTLEKWIHNGSYQKELDRGFTYYPGCGRFRSEPCQCNKCRRGKGATRQEVIDRHYKKV